MQVEITIPSRSVAIAAGVLRELLARGAITRLSDAESREIETVIHALDEADRIVIETDDLLPQEH
jgi:hypothetical protein